MPIYELIEIKEDDTEESIATIDSSVPVSHGEVIFVNDEQIYKVGLIIRNLTLNQNDKQLNNESFKVILDKIDYNELVDFEEEPQIINAGK